MLTSCQLCRFDRFMKSGARPTEGIPLSEFARDGKFDFEKRETTMNDADLKTLLKSRGYTDEQATHLSGGGKLADMPAGAEDDEGDDPEDTVRQAVKSLKVMGLSDEQIESVLSMCDKSSAAVAQDRRLAFDSENFYARYPEAKRVGISYGETEGERTARSLKASRGPDAAAAKGFAARFPSAANIKIL